VNDERRPRGDAVAIDGRWIGRGLPVYLVAAGGSRHGGDIQLGYKLIETAGAAGAHAILLQRGGLSEREVKSLFGHARQVGLTALGEAADEGDIDLLASLDVPGLRLGCDAWMLFERAAQAGRPILLSTRSFDTAALFCERAARAEVLLLAEEPELVELLMSAGSFGKPVGYAHASPDLAALGAALASGASLIEVPHELSDGGATLKAAAAWLSQTPQSPWAADGEEPLTR
jgi:sialic acid synthase SpsE